MKGKPIITKIEVNQIAWELKDIGVDPTGAIPTYEPGARYPMKACAVRMHTDEGIVGEFAPAQDISASAGYLLGKNALEREGVYNDLKVFRKQGIATVDILLWDIAGKRYGASISELLGGFRKRLPAYASTMNGAKSGPLSTPESFADFAEQCREIGYRAFKIHPYPRYPLELHVDAVHALGKRVGGKMDLMIDPFCYYKTFADALKVGYACDEEHFFWLEDPYMDGGQSHFAHRKLKEFIKTPLLQAEKVLGFEEHLNFMLSGGTDYVRGDPTWDGITSTLRIAHAAEGLGLDIELHGCGPAQRHVMSALRNSNYYEMVWVHPDTDCIFVPQTIYKSGYRDGLDAVDRDGCVMVPEGPGLGVEYDWAALKRMTTGSRVFE